MKKYVIQILLVYLLYFLPRSKHFEGSLQSCKQWYVAHFIFGLIEFPGTRAASVVRLRGCLFFQNMTSPWPDTAGYPKRERMERYVFPVLDYYFLKKKQILGRKM